MIFLETKIVNTLDKLCPYKTVQYRTECKSWLSAKTKEKMASRDLIREQARRSKDPDIWEEYKTLRNQVNREVNKDRNSHYNNLYKTHQVNKDVAAMYRTAKNQMGMKKNTSPTSFLNNGKIVSDPAVMAELQMQSFIDKINKLVNECPPPTIDPCALLQDSLNKWGQNKANRELFKFKPINKLETLKIINKLGNSTSSGNDRIDALALKHGAGVLHGPLTHIINRSIESSTFASRWKIGKLLPLHKGKGLSLNDPASFRPISLLPIIGKIKECALQPQILHFMETSGQ